MSSVKALAGKILSNAGYILYGSVHYVWKQPWGDAATKGRIPIKPYILTGNCHYEIMEAYNLREYDRRFLEKIHELPYNKVLYKLQPRKEPCVFVCPFFQEIQKEAVIPAHEITVKKWVFLTGKEEVSEQKIKIPYYRTMTLREILAKGSSRPAWCAQITIPAVHGRKAVESGKSRGDHHTILTIIGNEALCMELAGMNTEDLVALYHELFPHWYDYETPTGKGKIKVVIVTEQELNKAYGAVAKEMQRAEILYIKKFGSFS